MPGDADFATLIDGAGAAVTVAVSTSTTDGPVGGVPDTVAVFTIDPRSTSAWVTVYEAVQVVEALGASVLTGHVIADRPGSGSDTATDERVTLPVFLTTNE